MNDFSNFIKINLNKLCDWIDIERLCPALIDEGFLQEENLHKFYSLKIQDKTVFILSEVLNEINIKLFIHLLLLTGHDDIARYLSTYWLKVDISDMIDLSRCDPRKGFQSKFSFGEDRTLPKLVARGSKEESSTPYYEFKNSPRGFCVLINNYFTIGTFKEMQLFREIFYQLHFHVIMGKNLTKSDITTMICEISKSNELDKHDAFILMVIAHGNSKNEFYGFDGQPIKIRDLMDLLNEENCPKLKGKPRSFIINACRVDDVEVDISIKGESIKNLNLVAMKDEFVCYSTLHGFEAKGDWNSGTYFGKAFADSLIRKSCYRNLNQIMTSTNNNLASVKTNKQLIEWRQSSPKYLYFFPSIPHKIKFKHIV